MENKIPKIIHYAWFGGVIPEHTKAYIKTWEKCNQNYELKFWNEENFDIKSHAFTRDAFTFKKWAFVADFVRFWALYHYGGIWLDTDVEVFRSFDKLLELEYFIGNNSLNTHLDFSIIGVRKKHPFVKLGLEEYKRRMFIDHNGNLNCEFSPKSLIENVMNRVFARHGIKVVKGNDDLDILKEQQTSTSAILYTINNNILNSVHNTDNGKCFACHHHEGTWIKGNRLNVYDYTVEEIMEQQEKVGIPPIDYTFPKTNTNVSPLLLIANTILCNYCMLNTHGLQNGKMGVCIFLYEYARHSGIKEYEDIADDILDSILNTLHKSQHHDNITLIAGIGIGLIYLLTHEYLEDTDDNDTLEEIDNFIFHFLGTAQSHSESVVSASLYFIYRSMYYRANLERKKCHDLAIHVSDLFQNTITEEQTSSCIPYIIHQANLIQKSALDENTFINGILPSATEICIQTEQKSTKNTKMYWFKCLSGSTKKDIPYDKTALQDMCKNCFYDAERTLETLCCIGILEIKNNVL